MPAGRRKLPSLPASPEYEAHSIPRPRTAPNISGESRLKTRFACLKPYLARQKGSILAGLAFVLVSTALDQVSPWMVKEILESLARGETFSAVLWPLGAILASTLVSGILLYFQ